MYISQESFNFLAASNVMCFLRDALHLRGQHQIYKYIEKNPTRWMPRQFHESVVLKVPVLPPLCPIIQNHHTHPKHFGHFYLIQDFTQAVTLPPH